MKCPKCRYVSHDYLASCRKCGADLVAFKQDMGLLVLQAGELDLSLVLGEAGVDDFFASVEEKVTMHAGNDDFEIGLDDSDQPGVWRDPVGAPRAGARETAEESADLEQLTLAPDALALSAEWAASLSAAPTLPDAPPQSPTLAVPPPAAPGGSMLPGHVTLDMEFASMSAELPPGVLANLAAMLPPHVPDTAATPAERSEMAASVDAEHAEGIDQVASAAEAPGAMPSVPLPDIILAEDTAASVAETALPDLVMPTLDNVPLTLTDKNVSPTATTSTGPEQGLPPSDALALGDLDKTTLPGHLTLELDASEIMANWSSMTLDDLQLDDPPGDVQSKMSPPQDQAGDEEALLLDLDDVEYDDDALA